MPPPRLATTYAGRDFTLLTDVLPHVDVLEVTPDVISVAPGDTSSGRRRLDAEVAAELVDVSHDVDLVAHGVGLSIGSHDRWCEDYLVILDELFNNVDLAWHSEHLGYTRVEGQFLGSMLTLPRTQEALDLVCARVQLLQQRYDRPFLLEHVARLMPDPGGCWSEAELLAQVSRQTACGLLLDLYNLECDALNHGTEPCAFLAELPLGSVREIHVAGGTTHRGFQLDVHSRLVAGTTLDLLEQVLPKMPAVELVTYEVMPEAVPSIGRRAIVDQLCQLRAIIAACGTT